MGYRYDIPPKPDPEDMLPVFDMFNNEIRTWSIPCFYLEVDKPIDWHDPKCHDHHGWPRPNMPDHVCQAPWEHYDKYLSPYSFWQYIDMDKAVKIHFGSLYEGPFAVEYRFDPYDSEGHEVDTSNIDMSVDIRDNEDWIIDLTFDAHLPHFASEPQEFIFNVYLETFTGSGSATAKSLLVRGKLVVLPG